MKIFSLLIIVTFFLACSSTAGDKNGNQARASLRGSCQCPTPDTDKLESPEGMNLMGMLNTVNVVKGRVSNDNGQAIRGAAVRVFETKEEKNPMGSLIEKGKQLAICGTTASGEFCFPDLKPGIYALLVSAGKEYFRQEKTVRLVTENITTTKPLEIIVGRSS
jgi:hypothetical protein